MPTEKNAPELEDEQAEEPQKLDLSIKVATPSACQRHVTVTIKREEIERYYDKAFSDLMTSANVPGFRSGRAPRKLVEARFRKEVADQVKGSLLMDSMTQITEDENFSAISEPDFDPLAVELPDEGPMTFEFDLEVRPEFELPEWKGLKVERPKREISKKDIDKRLEQILARHGRLVPSETPAAVGDYISCNLTFKNGAVELSSSKEEVIRIRPVLSFRDGKIEGFDKLMKGVKPGQTREAKARLSEDAPNEPLRGQEITAVFEVLEVKKLELPELSPALLEELGDFKDEGELRDAIQEDLKRQDEYQQQREARRQVTAALTESANWQLPPELLRRQSRRELERAVLELRRNGFTDAEIRAYENELRQNSAASTARALKEHFILERIAEDQEIDASPEDYQAEIALIAAQSGESVRRVRARLDKGGLMDSLRNQIIERKVIELVLSHANFKDVPYKPESMDTEALDQAAGGGEEEESSIPEAKNPGEAEPLRTAKEHD
ncbi:MAG TPA: trigger factor [Pirellulales bacterium]|jgi:trigger factor|nr:trigger factor [Pirellulales bacterium]